MNSADVQKYRNTTRQGQNAEVETECRGSKEAVNTKEILEKITQNH